MSMILSILLLLLLPLLILSFWRKDNNNNNNVINNGVRGVLVHYQSKYNNDDNRLLCDNNKELNTNDINDGYCDCDDGFDEPGTSACTNGKFHCNNKGYKAIVLSSSRVDDGICDCCDGSDEGTIIQCKDTCNQVAYKEREHLNKLTTAYKIGKGLRESYITSVRNEKESKAATLTYVKGEIERQKATTSALQKEKEKEEAQINDQQQTIVNNHKNRIKDELHISKFNDNDLVHFLLTTFDVLELTIDDVNNNFKSIRGEVIDVNDNDKSYDDDEERKHYDDENQINDDDEVASDDPSPVDETEISDSDDVITDTPPCSLVINYGDDRLKGFCSSDNHMNPEKLQNDASDLIVDILKTSKQYQHIQLIIGYYKIMQNFRGASQFIKIHLASNDQTCPGLWGNSEHDVCNIGSRLEVLINNANSNESSEIKRPWLDKYNEANERLQLLEIEETDASSAANELEKYNDKLEYLHLKDQCFPTIDGKFTYNVCVMKTVTQKETHGNNDVTLGKFDSISDDDKGNVIMHFTEGDHCWNHGNRKADVTIRCGKENKLISATEPSTCFYTLEFESPAACSEKFADFNGILV